MIEKYQLPNGLKVILCPSHKSPVVTVQAWVRTGSADERKGEEGISHFIEHLFFKGTRKFKVGEISSLIEGSGGELNAYTSFDQTVFYMTLSKHFTETALDALHEMMGFPEFDAKEIDNEREVVIEEIKRSNDNPQRFASQMLFSSVYQKHPYRVPVLGFDENIQNFPREKIANYFHARYSPQNMALVMCGDFETPEAKKLIGSYFGKIQKTPVRKSLRPKEPPQKAPRIEVKKNPFKETLTHLAWRIPSALHKDTPALDVLALILGQGDSSRLTHRLRIESPIVNYVGSHAFTPQDEGFFGVSAGLNAENLKTFLDGVGEEILRIQIEPPAPQELEKAISNFEADEFFGIETVDGLARKLGSYELLFHRPEYFKTYLEKLAKVRGDEVSAVARKYLTADRLTAVCSVSGNEAAAQKHLEKFSHDLALAQDALKKVTPPKAAKAKVQRIKPGPKSQVKESVEKFHCLGKTPVIFVASSQAPTVSLRVAFRGGQRVEPEGKSGLSELLANTWTGGTKTKTEKEVLEKLDALATSIRPFAGRNTVGLSLSSIVPRFEESAALFFELLREPAFLNDTVEREKVLHLESLSQKHDNPAMVAMEHFHRMIFGNHPYAKDTLGTPESIASITREDIKSHWHNMVSKSNATFSAAGDWEKGSLAKMIEAGAKDLRQGQPLRETFTVGPITEDLKHFEKLEKEQSHVVCGVRGLSIYDTERTALQVLQAVLGGMGGRLFNELREKASLAYSVSPLNMEGLEVGYVGAYIGCSPEKAAKAIEMMEIEFKKLTDSKIPEEELQRAKRYLIGRHDIGLQKNSAISSAVLFEEVYGLPYTNVYDFDESIKAVSAYDVLGLAQKLFSQKRVVACVGPTRPW